MPEISGSLHVIGFHVKLKRDQIDPNFNFYKELKEVTQNNYTQKQVIMLNLPSKSRMPKKSKFHIETIYVKLTWKN